MIKNGLNLFFFFSAFFLFFLNLKSENNDVEKIKTKSKRNDSVATPRSVAFAFFASDAFKIFHFGGDDRRSNEANVVQLCHFAATLIVLDEHLDVLNILEFYVA